MEFKLFGPGGFPSRHFQTDLRGLLALDNEAWEVLANCFYYCFRVQRDFARDFCDAPKLAL